MDVKCLLDKIKSMEYYDVSIPIPPAVFYTYGEIPFWFSVDEERIVCKVLASSYQEACEKVFRYFNPDIGDTI